MKNLVLFQRSIELDKMYRNFLFYFFIFISFLFFIRVITEKNKFLYFKLNKQSLKSMGVSSHPEMWKELFFGESYQSLCFWGLRPEKCIPWKITTFFSWLKYKKFFRMGSCLFIRKWRNFKSCGSRSNKASFQNIGNFQSIIS